MNSLRYPEKEINKKNHKILWVVPPIDKNDTNSAKKNTNKTCSKNKLPNIFIKSKPPHSKTESKLDYNIFYPTKNRRKNVNNQLSSPLQNGYILTKSFSLNIFLQENKEIVSLLNEAYKELRKYFSSEDLKLELVSDPEIAGNQQLFVYIFTSLSVTDALSKLDEFDEQWWLDRIDRANGLVNFNLRFV